MIHRHPGKPICNEDPMTRNKRTQPRKSGMTPRESGTVMRGADPAKRPLMSSAKDSQNFRLLLSQLIHGALLGGFIRTPAQQFGAVTEAPAGDVIVLHLHD